jgi:hypothetical protein
LGSLNSAGAGIGVERLVKRVRFVGVVVGSGALKHRFDVLVAV